MTYLCVVCLSPLSPLSLSHTVYSIRVVKGGRPLWAPPPPRALLTYLWGEADGQPFAGGFAGGAKLLCVCVGKEQVGVDVFTHVRGFSCIVSLFLRVRVLQW